MSFNKRLLGIAVSAALGLGASVANAGVITSFTFADIDGDGTAGDFNFGGPPIIGGNNSFNPTGSGLVPNSAARTIDEFTTGFQYSFYGEFHPYTFDDGLTGTITGNGTSDTSSFGVNWGGAFFPGGNPPSIDFDLAPDPGTLTATVSNFTATTADVVLEWNHVIQDPGGDFDGQNAFWYAEFSVTHEAANPVPVPAAAWLFGSGLMGLVGVARRRKKA